MTALSRSPRLLGLLIVLLAALVILGSMFLPIGPRHASADEIHDGFVRRDAGHFTLDGRRFQVKGVNNHYLGFASKREIDAVLDDAKRLGANTVRTFLQPVIGSLDGTVPTIWAWKADKDSSQMGAKGRYMLFFDPKTKSAAFNDGPDGLGRFDYVVAGAKARHLKLIVALVDFWGYSGGAQQINAWYGSRDKYTFFAADARAKSAYKAWVAHAIAHRNPSTGLTYADDPTIMAWDLANEPDIHPIPLMIDWVAEMAGYLKGLDKNHLVASGRASMREPFAELDVPAVDFGTWHGYPSYEKMTADDFDALALRNCALSEEYGKPILLEEFGFVKGPSQAAETGKLIADLDRDPACAGWVVWRLVGRQDGNHWPMDTDGFDVKADGSDLWTAIANEMKASPAPTRRAQQP